MPWVRLDDRFDEHPKVEGLSDRAFRLHVAAMCYCGRNATDGKIPSKRALRMVENATRSHIKELVKLGLWDTAPGGYQIHDWLDYNPSRDEIEAQKRESSERGRRAARARWDRTPDANRNAERMHDAYGHASEVRCPDPTPTKELSSTVRKRGAVDKPVGATQTADGIIFLPGSGPLPETP